MAMCSVCKVENESWIMDWQTSTDAVTGQASIVPHTVLLNNWA